MKLSRRSIFEGSRRWTSFSLCLLLALVIFAPAAVNAAGQLSARKVTMSDPTISASSVTYTYNFTVATSNILKGMEFMTCTTAFGTCTAPTGLTYAGAATGSNPTTVTGTGMGTTTNWVKDATSTANNARYTYTANATSTTAASALVFAYNGVTNGSLNNTPYYIRITTYTDVSFASSSDIGNVVAVPTNAITVTGTVQEQLTFCVYTGASCGTGTTVTVPSGGILSSSSNNTNTSKFDLATNANSGVSVSYVASVLTGPSQTIPAAGAQTHTAVTPTAGTESYALSLTGTTGTVAAANGYGSYFINTNGSFDQIASATATAASTGTVTYAINISSVTKPGVYTSTVDYQAVATF
jgi:hypothetical protein